MDQNNQLQELIAFVQKATKLGKYNQNTGGGIINAIKVAEKGFLPDEPKDIEYLINHLEELFFRQTDLNLSLQSQAVYFTRIRRAVEDYKKYGTDARSIYSWSPKQRIKKATSKNNNSGKADEESDTIDKPIVQGLANVYEPVIKEVGGVKLNVVTWRLRPGVLIKIELPEDLNRTDVEKIKKLFDLEVEGID